MVLEVHPSAGRLVEGDGGEEEIDAQESMDSGSKTEPNVDEWRQHDATALFLYDATATAALLLGSSPRTTATDVTPYPSFLLMPPHSSIEVPGPPDRGTQPIGVSGGVVVVDKYDRIQGG